MLHAGTRPSFLIVDDHPLFLEALQSALERGYPQSRIEVADSLGGARDKLAKQVFNLVLMDLRMPDVKGFEGVAALRSHAPGAQIAVISAAEGPEFVSKAKASGACGFIPKSQSRSLILQAVSQLLGGGQSFPAASAAPRAADPEADGVLEKLRQLTPQQFKVLTRVCEAKLNKQIAFELNVTETTIKAHVTLIFKKLGVHSRTQAVLLMQRIKSHLKDSEFAALVAAEV